MWYKTQQWGMGAVYWIWKAQGREEIDTDFACKRAELLLVDRERNWGERKNGGRRSEGKIMECGGRLQMWVVILMDSSINRDLFGYQKWCKFNIWLSAFLGGGREENTHWMLETGTRGEAGRLFHRGWFWVAGHRDGKICVVFHVCARAYVSACYPTGNTCAPCNYTHYTAGCGSAWYAGRRQKNIWIVDSIVAQ